MKKISHEVPLCFLQDNLHWSDYQYVLPHLIDKHAQYKEFMLSYREQEDSFIIMDNGLFEGVTHTEKDLIEKINLVKPDIFVVPDMWNNKKATAHNATHWMINIKPHLPENTNLMVVMQGEIISDFFSLYQECTALGYTHFAFNHSSQYYQTYLGTHPDKLVNQMLGRHSLINLMRASHFIKDNHYIHLLGCSLPQEFAFYKYPEFDFIKSVDTSNPIIVGAQPKVYEVYGLSTKPSEKIEDFMEKDLNQYKTIINFNVEKFRNLIK